MKEKLEAKISEILEYVLEKDVAEITPCDYGILDAALKDIRMREAQEESNKKFQKTMAELMAVPFSATLS